MAEKIRGSELLKQRYTGKDLEHLLSVSEQVSGVELVQFFPIGIPIDPDGPDGASGHWTSAWTTCRS